MFYEIILSDLPLNLNFFEILIHMTTLAILVLIVRFVLYKPIKKFVKEREDEFEQIDNEREQKLFEATKLKEEYEQALLDAKKKAMQISDESLEAAKVRAEAIIEEAKKKANEMVKIADNEISRKKEDEVLALKLSISELACTMAQEILNRELTNQDIDQQINEIVTEWNNK